MSKKDYEKYKNILFSNTQKQKNEENEKLNQQ